MHLQKMILTCGIVPSPEGGVAVQSGFPAGLWQAIYGQYGNAECVSVSPINNDQGVKLK